MKKGVLYYLMMLIAASSLCLTACGDDEPEVPGQNDRPGSSYPDNGSDESSDVASIVRANTSCTSSYSDYHVNITLNHTILSELPNASISYVIGHSEQWSSTCQVISGGQYSIIPTETSSGNSKNVKFQFPFYYYFMAKNAEASSYSDKQYYSNASAECEMYLRTYMALKNKSSMSASERSLFNEAKSSLNKYQNEVRGSYAVWVYVRINGKNHLVKSINI